MKRTLAIVVAVAIPAALYASYRHHAASKATARFASLLAVEAATADVARLKEAMDARPSPSGPVMLEAALEKLERKEAEAVGFGIPAEEIEARKRSGTMRAFDEWEQSQKAKHR